MQYSFLNMKRGCLSQWAAFSVKPCRAPILKTPLDYGIAYQSVFFRSMDRVELEGWLIPAASNKLVICNHGHAMNRYGYPGKLHPWSHISTVEANLITLYKHLHDAGYNVLAFDFRNHGYSGFADGGVCGHGLYEWRDVVGAMLYVNNHPKLSKMELSLLSHGMGANAAFTAMAKYPGYFKTLQCQLAIQPYAVSAFMQQIVKTRGVNRPGDFEEEQLRLGGLANRVMSPRVYAEHAATPTMLVQFADDEWSDPADVKAVFEALGATEKKLLRIRGIRDHFACFNYFGDYPQPMLEWLNKYSYQRTLDKPALSNAI